MRPAGTLTADFVGIRTHRNMDDQLPISPGSNLLDLSVTGGQRTLAEAHRERDLLRSRPTPDQLTSMGSTGDCEPLTACQRMLQQGAQKRIGIPSTAGNNQNAICGSSLQSGKCLPLFT